MAIRTRWISDWENTADICKYAIISDLHIYINTVHRLKKSALIWVVLKILK